MSVIDVGPRSTSIKGERLALQHPPARGRGLERLAAKLVKSWRSRASETIGNRAQPMAVSRSERWIFSPVLDLCLKTARTAAGFRGEAPRQ
jgi:hypothetical protein